MIHCGASLSRALATLLLLGLSGVALGQPAEDGFAPALNGVVSTLTQQPDGKLLAAGQFTFVGSDARGRVARFHNDGQLDAFFNANANAPVLAMGLQGDGKVVLGGQFTLMNGQSQPYLARVSGTGALDASFIPAVDGAVRAIDTQVGNNGIGRICLGGDFSTVQGHLRRRLACLNANGSIQEGFAPPHFNGSIRALLHSQFSQFYVAGTFTQINGVSTTAPVARLNPTTGALDAGFQPVVSSGHAQGAEIRALAALPAGKLLIAGRFESVSGATRHHIARLNADGSLDSTFLPPPFNAPISAIHVLPDGRILVAGDFTPHAQLQRVTRLNPDGSWDGVFSAAVQGEVLAMAVQTDGKLAIGGNFQTIGGQARQRMARLRADGDLERDFVPVLPPANILGADAVAVQADGRILAGLRALGSPSLRRFLPDGSIDSGFSGGSVVGSGVQAIAVQPDRRILVVSRQVGDATPIVLRRLQPTGTLDTSFQIPQFSSNVATLAIQPDGAILAGGLFTQVNGQARSRLVRLTSNGDLDPGFTPSVNGMVRSIALQPDGRIVIAGMFTEVNGHTRRYLARLHADGSLDADFQPNVSGWGIYATALLPDGRIVIGGVIDSVDFEDQLGLARLLANGRRDASFGNPFRIMTTSITALTPMAGGQIMAVGERYDDTSSHAIAYVVGATGTVAQTFTGFTQSSSIWSVALQSDGMAVLAGTFAEAAGTPRPYLARLAPTGFAISQLQPSFTGFVWRRTGLEPEFALPPQLYVADSCCNATAFEAVPGAYFQRHANGNWYVSNLDQHAGGRVWVRARGLVSDGGAGLSVVESPAVLYELPTFSDVIFANGFE